MNNGAVDHRSVFLSPDPPKHDRTVPTDGGNQFTGGVKATAQDHVAVASDDLNNGH